jgi:hypothetical protein
MPGRSQTSSPRRSSRMALRRRARRSLVGFTATDITQPDELLRRWTWPRFPRPAWSRSMRRIRRPGPAAAFGSPGKAARPLLTSRSSSGRISPAHWRLTPGRRRGSSRTTRETASADLVVPHCVSGRSRRTGRPDRPPPRRRPATWALLAPPHGPLHSGNRDLHLHARDLDTAPGPAAVRYALQRRGLGPGPPRLQSAEERLPQRRDDYEMAPGRCRQQFRSSPRNRESMPIDANGSTYRTRPHRGSGRLGGQLARAIKDPSIALGGDHRDHRTDPVSC